ncbi:hypothetical protein HEP81_07373 [Streptomyces griseofuscus]|uniref:Uncharacterized protein n=1 Tax=Streptomyces griseofuscus TaxID=146922 RepID=A0A7H1QBC5_9ACTN|nr:hypothetical protein [Streptomyces murinus]QNT97605.1 hypothetical protein HEP81_07373 [Streptomyces griseofuscus]
MSRHGAPVRTRHRIPLISIRFDLEGLPVVAEAGRSGSSTAH